MAIFQVKKLYLRLFSPVVPKETYPFSGPLSETTRVSRYQNGKTNLDFTKARDSEWQWHQLGRMQVCTSLQTDNHASTPPFSFLQAGCPYCHVPPKQQRQSTELVRIGVEFNAPLDTILVISEAVFTANHLTDTDKQNSTGKYR